MVSSKDSSGHPNLLSEGNQWLIFDVDGTRRAARQRALPSTPDLPPAQRRLDEVCAPGYTGRKRGETVRTRTTVLHVVRNDRERMISWILLPIGNRIHEIIRVKRHPDTTRYQAVVQT